jgi:multidrug efflux pump subunit AcrB
MRAGGNILTLGNNVQGAMSRITADLPTGIEAKLVADQPLMVKHAVNEFLEALWEAVAIVLAVSFLSLGFRAGAVVAFSIPIVLAVVFTVMYAAGIDFQRVSLGALIIALGLLVDDAMITTETMVSRLEGGDNKTSAATYAYNTTAFPMLTGTLVTICGFVPIGFAQSDAGEYTFSLFAVVSIALITSWFVAVLFAPLFGVAILPSKFKRHSDKPSRGRIVFRTILARAMRWRWLTWLHTLYGVAFLGFMLVNYGFTPLTDVKGLGDEATGWAYGWADTAAAVEAARTEHKAGFVATADYTTAGLLGYAMADKDVVSLNSHRDQFDYWFDPAAHAGQDAILFGDTWRPLRADVTAQFTGIVPLAEIPVIRGGKEIDRHQIYLGKGFIPVP